MSRSSIPRLARVRDGHQTKRRRAAAQKKQASAERVALRRAKQDLNANNKGDQHPPQAMGGLPVYPSSAETPQLWWQCEFCEHAVRYVDFPKNPEAMHRARKVHLSQAHGIDKPPCLNKRSNLSTVPNRVNEASEAFDIRWKAVWQAFQSKRWKGSHDIDCKVHTWRQHERKDGHKWCRPFHECRQCKLLISRDNLVPSVCSKGKGRNPSLEVKKAIWKDCRRAGQEAIKTLRHSKKSRKLKRWCPD